MVLSIRTRKKVISIPGCLPGGVGYSSNRLLPMGELLLSCHSTVCTVCMSGGGVCSLIHVSFGSFERLLRLCLLLDLMFGSV